MATPRVDTARQTRHGPAPTTSLIERANGAVIRGDGIATTAGQPRRSTTGSPKPTRQGGSALRHAKGHPALVDPVRAARAFVADCFPTAWAAYLGGSTGTVFQSPTSDLDIVVVLDGEPAPFRQTLRHDGWLVEVFAHTVASFDAFVERETAGRRSPLLHMCALGQVLVDRDGGAVGLQERAQARLAAGPALLSVTEREDRRYLISDLLDDLTGCQDGDELIFIGVRLLTAVGELVLLEKRVWLGRGKWLLRRLRQTDPGTCEQLVGGFRGLVAGGNPAALRQAAEVVLNRSGGRLMEGYRRDSTLGPA